MTTEPYEMLDRLRDRLTQRAWLLDDGDSYRAGVDDALDELRTAIDTRELDLVAISQEAERARRQA